jgi:hypothetical protein
MNEIYVVVAENDKPFKRPSGDEFHDEMGPLVFEQYTRTADLDSVQRRAETLGRAYGKCRIAKLIFIDGE